MFAPNSTEVFPEEKLLGKVMELGFTREEA
jgi:hypothetical protein